MFGKDKGWQALAGDIWTFCQVLQFEPTNHVLGHLLRVQNLGKEGSRLSLPKSSVEQFHVIAVSSLFRAVVYGIPTYLFHEDEQRAQAWVEALSAFGARAIEPLQSQLQVSKQRRFVVANGIHVAHCIGPWDDDSKFRVGKQDIILLDFDATPTFRVKRVCELTNGTILYAPQHEFLAKPKNRRKDSNG